MAFPEVYLTGTYINHVTRMPHVGVARITPIDKTLPDPADDLVLFGGGDVPLVEGAFRIALPAEGREYSVQVVLTGNPRQELEPVVVTLDQALAEEITEPEEGGTTVTFYEQDVTDFYTP